MATSDLLETDSLLKKRGRHVTGVDQQRQVAPVPSSFKDDTEAKDDYGKERSAVTRKSETESFNVPKNKVNIPTLRTYE